MVKRARTSTRTGRTLALAGAWIPIGGAVGVALGAVYRDVAGFTAAGAAIGVVLAALTLVYRIARTRGELSWPQFAGGLMLVGALGFGLGAIFVPDRLLFYGLLAALLCLPAAIWLASSIWNSKPIPS